MQPILVEVSDNEFEAVDLPTTSPERFERVQRHWHRFWVRFWRINSLRAIWHGLGMCLQRHKSVPRIKRN
jgi:hypothetical protein